MKQQQNKRVPNSKRCLYIHLLQKCHCGNAVEMKWSCKDRRVSGNQLKAIILKHFKEKILPLTKDISISAITWAQLHAVTQDSTQIRQEDRQAGAGFTVLSTDEKVPRQKAFENAVVVKRQHIIPEQTLKA